MPSFAPFTRSRLIIWLVYFAIFTPMVWTTFGAPPMEEILYALIFAVVFTFLSTWHYPLFKSRHHGAIFNIVVAWLIPIFTHFSMLSVPSDLYDFALSRALGAALLISAATLTLTYVLRPSARTKPKWTLLYLVPIVLLLIEVAGNASFHIVSGQFMWEPKTEFFNIRPYTDQVGDARVFTSKQNYSDELYSFDENRFRGTAAGYTAEGPNIVFIGDSVPFGMGVKNNEVAASRLAELVDGYGVINAAIPSYSLHQTIARFKAEIAGKYSDDVVILQIYDPASQFSIWGSEWSPEISWASDDRKFDEKRDFIRNHPLLKYSFILFVAFPRNDQRVRDELELDKNDQLAFDRFKEINFKELAELRDLVKGQLFILPINNPPAFVNYYPPEHQLAVATLNDVLKEFAASTAEVYFLDIREHFKNLESDNLFLDACCHLTPAGHKAAAEFIYEQIKPLLTNN